MHYETTDPGTEAGVTAFHFVRTAFLSCPPPIDFFSSHPGLSAGIGLHISKRISLSQPSQTLRHRDFLAVFAEQVDVVEADVALAAVACTEREVLDFGRV